MQRIGNLVDLEKRCKMSIWLQNFASIQPRTSPVKFDHLAEKSEKDTVSNLAPKAILALRHPMQRQTTTLSWKVRYRTTLWFSQMIKLYRARSRLYRSKMLQPNTPFGFCSVFRNLQDFQPFAPIETDFFLKCSSIVSDFHQGFCKNRDLNFQRFSPNFAPILMKFSRKFAKFRRECWEFVKFLDFWRIPTECEQNFDAFW